MASNVSDLASSLMNTTDVLSLVTNGTTDSPGGDPLNWLGYSSPVFGYLYVLLIPFVVIGNVLVLIVIVKVPKLHTPSNVFIVSLSCSDLLLGVLTLPVYALYNFSTSYAVHGNKMLCLVKWASVICSLGGSIVSLTLIAIDRFIVTVYPLRYSSIMTMYRAKVIVVLHGIYYLINGLVPTLGANNWDSVGICDYWLVLPYAYTLYNSTCVVAICYIMTIVLYAIIFKTVRDRHRKIAQNTGTSSVTSLARQFKKEAKLAKLMAFILFLFMLFWLPFFLSAILRYTSLAGWVVETIKNAAVIFAMSNSIVNPIIYVWKRRDFRIAMKGLLGLRRSENNSQGTQLSIVNINT